MKILLTGRNGQVGWELNRTLLPLGTIVALDRHGADLSRPETLREQLDAVGPDVIVNAAAYTAVDKAEEESDLAMTINGVAPGILAEEAKKRGALLVHLSTDYVFDGSKDGLYTESDVPNPLNIYGHSKLAGERAIQDAGCDYLIFRTSWVYASRGKNFLLTMLRIAQEKNSITIVGDQFGAPTWARFIAETVSHCIGRAEAGRRSEGFVSGVYHLTSSGYTSWHGFAESIIDLAADRLSLKSLVSNISAIPTSEYRTAAKRPANSRMSTEKLEAEFDLEMPEWDQCLGLCIEDMK